MIRICFSIIAAIMVIAVALCGCSQPAPAPSSPTHEPSSPSPTPSSSSEPIVWRYNGTMPPTHSVTIGCQRWVDLVNERGAGKVSVEFFPTAQLYASHDVPTALPSGAIDMSECTPSTLQGIIPSTGIIELPFLFSSADELAAVMEDGQDIMAAEMESKNLKLMFFIDGGVFSGPLTTKKAVRELEDWQGLRLRGTGAVASKMIEIFGAGPVSMSGGEVYGALQKGTIDGTTGGYPSYIQRKWFELCQYAPEYAISYSWFPQVANLDAWNKLPPDVQQIMLDAGKEVASEQAALAAKEFSDTKDQLAAEGLELISLTPDQLTRWKEVCKAQLWDEWAKESSATAELLDLALSQ